MRKLKVVAQVLPDGRYNISAQDIERKRKFIEKAKDKTVQCTYEIVSPSRSAQQNRYYWIIIADYLNFLLLEVGDEDYLILDADKLLHKRCKATFGKKDETVNIETGEVFYILASTSKYSMYEMAMYMDCILLHSRKEGAIIRDSEEYNHQKLLAELKEKEIAKKVN
jgi:hypothetical protein